MPLPLKLAAFERYMWADDQPNYPMAYTIRLTCSGTVDRAAFTLAAEAAVRRHPMFRARIVGTSHRDLTWVSSPDSKPYLDFGVEGEPLWCPGGVRIDLREENGVRIWVRSGFQRVCICFQMHHSCSDGVGAYRFIEDLLCVYDHLVRGEAATPTLRPLEPELLKHRTHFGLSRWRRLLHSPIDAAGIAAGLATLIFTRSASLVPTREPDPDRALPQTLPDVVSHTFDNAQLKNLLAAARNSAATFNDIICRDVFLGMYAWNVRHDLKVSRRSMRLMIPFNLRTNDDEPMPAANVVGMAFLQRRLSRRPYRDPTRLLASIRRTTKLLKLLHMGVTYNYGCGLLTRIPHPERKMARYRRCWATSALSNMGRLFGEAPLPQRDGKLVAGDLTVEVVESAPPVRKSSNASFGVHSYVGKLTLTMNYDRERFAPGSAEKLLGLVVQRIEQSAAQRPSQEVVHDYRWWWLRVWHGMRLGDWLRLLAKNRFCVHPRRFYLAGSITASAILVSGLARLQQMIYGRRLARVKINRPPVFIIGHWRSGTTYLHELLTQDEQFTAPTALECGAAHHCLLTERTIRRFFKFMVPNQRPMDNMTLAWDTPQEEEIALATMGAPSPYLNWAFPRRAAVNVDCLDMAGVSQRDLARWKETLLQFLRLVTYRRPKRLVLKSPTNTGRIELLAKMFPGARFVHMVRDPLTMFPSTMRLWHALDSVQGLQPPAAETRKQYVFDCYERMYRAFRRQRRSLDPGSICDVRYEDLVRDPVGQVRRVYEKLNLGDFEQTRPRVEALVATKRGYKPNQHRLDEQTAAEVAHRWATYAQDYGYATRAKAA